jgi:hypothetical protein
VLDQFVFVDHLVEFDKFLNLVLILIVVQLEFVLVEILVVIIEILIMLFVNQH